MSRKLPLALAATTLASAAALMTVGTPGASAPARAAAPAPAPQAQKRPNVLFILIDDMGYADPSITGDTKMATPNFDRIAHEGLLMTQFYDAAPICSASRAGFFTGQWPLRNKFVTFIHSSQGDAEAGQADWLPLTVPNIAQSFKQAGYATGHFGKWHMGGGRDVCNAPLITRYGFDESLTQFEGLGPRVLPQDVDKGLSATSAKCGQGPIQDVNKAEMTPAFVDKTLDFTNRHKTGAPWFVQVWPSDVHAPWAPTGDQLTAAGTRGRDEAENKFLAVLKATDAQVGRLLDGLKAQGQLDNTLIVFTSDNGPTANKPGHLSPGSAGDFRGRKASLYEGGVRQPLLVRWPGHVPAGKRDDTTVGQGVDLWPSIAAMVGVKGPAKPDGISLASAWQGTPITRRPDLFWTFGAFAMRGPQERATNRDASLPFSMRSGNWKLLIGPDGATPELYDLAKDPGETQNVAARQPAVVKEMTAKLVGWYKPFNPVISDGSKGGRNQRQRAGGDEG